MNRVLILEGGPSVDFYDQREDMIKFGYEVTEMCNLFTDPQQLLTLPVINPDYIFIGTTGMHVEENQILVDIFESLKWLPKNVIFGGERSTFAFLGLARKIKPFGVKFWDVSYDSLEEIDWI